MAESPQSLQAYQDLHHLFTQTSLTADFLVDDAGVIVDAYYGKDEGDHLPLSEVIAFAKRLSSAAISEASS